MERHTCGFPSVSLCDYSVGMYTEHCGKRRGVVCGRASRTVNHII